MKVKLDQTCIDYGVKGSPLFCPVSHAIRRSIDNFKTYVLVRNYKTAQITFCFEKTKVSQTIKLPKKIRKLAKAFDKGEEIKPTTFEIEELHCEAFIR